MISTATNPATPHVLLFGGAFNPPTLAHDAIIARCLALAGFDQVWLLPSGDRRDKTVGDTDADRLAMLHLVREARFANDPRLRVSDFELALPRPNSTYDTMQALRMAFPATMFTLLVGGDSYSDMPNWPHGRELQTSLRLLVLPRGPAPLPPLSANATALDIDPTYQAISSTQVRQRLAMGQPVDDLVSAVIADYLRTHRHYLPRRP